MVGCSSPFVLPEIKYRTDCEELLPRGNIYSTFTFRSQCVDLSFLFSFIEGK